MSTLPPYTQIDDLPRTTPLGLRFWDSATQTIIRDGLKVTVSQKLAGTQSNLKPRTVEALPNRSGIYIVHNSPYGMDPDFYFGEGDDNFWALHSAVRAVDIFVVDLERRFVPVQFTANLPQRGLFTLVCTDRSSEPPVSLPSESVPLFSASSRTKPTGTAVVRADMRQSDGETPAAWAFLEVYQDSDGSSNLLGSGITDKDGHIAVFFPYPVPDEGSAGAVLGSLPGTGPVPLHMQQWILKFKVYFNEGTEQLKAPDLCQIFSQTQNSLRADFSLHDVLEAQTLTYGQDCILRTESYSWVAVGN